MKAIPFLLAVNYFSFRVELFEKESEQNEPVMDLYTGGSLYVPPTLNWETFDKDNATKAFVIHPPVMILILGTLDAPDIIIRTTVLSYGPIRDKSPPSDSFIFAL